MADDLGTAVLTITVNDKEARDTLRSLRQEVARTSGVTGGRSRSGGAREDVRALEKAQERRFNLTQRINNLEGRGANVSRLRLQLARLESAETTQQYEQQRRLSVELSRQVRLAQTRQIAVERTAITEQQIATRASAQVARAARQGGPREDFRALEKAQERRFRLSQRIETLEERGADVSRLRTRLGQLTEAQSTRQFGTFRQVSQELSRQVALTERRLRLAEQAQRAEQQAARIGARQGGARESIDALTNAQKRRYGLDQQILSLEAAGINTAKLRNQLGEATTAQANRQFGLFDRLADTLNFDLRKQRDKLKVLQDQNREVARLARQGGAREPLQGRIGLPGSPADITFQARQGGPRSPIGGSTAIPGSPAALRAEERLTAARERAAKVAERARLAQERATQAEDRRIGRLNAAPVRGGAAFPGSPAFFDKIFPRLSPQQLRQLETSRIRAGTRERVTPLDQRLPPVSGRVSGAISSGIIGGGFPLLFGQGIGAAIGGGIGGVGGGALGGGFGFGLSVVGTAIGAAFDEALNKGKALATGLKDPINQFDALQQASLLSSKSVERQAQGLIAAGREAEAAALIQQDLARAYGDTSGLNALTNSFDELARVFARLSITTAQYVSGPLTEFLDRLAGSLTITPQRQLDIEAQAGAAVAAETGPLGIKGSGFFGALEVNFNGKKYKGSATGIRQSIITDLVRKDLEGTRAAAANTAAPSSPEIEQKRSRVLADQFRLIAAQAQGYKDLQLQRERDLSLSREALDVENLRARKATAPEIAQRQQQGDLERQNIAEQLLVLERNTTAEQLVRNAALQQESNLLSRRLAFAQQIATTEAGVVRNALEQRQAVIDTVAAARERERQLAAEFAAAQTRGNTGDASRIAQQQVAAANETRLALIQGATALRDSGKQLRDDLRSAVLSLTQIRSEQGGLNRFLSNQDIQRRAQQDFQALQPAFREAQARFTGLTGARAPEFSGTTAGVNDSIRDFIAAVDREFDATKTVTDTTRALADTNNALLSVNQALAAVTADLVAKNWTVNLNQGADGRFTATGDVLLQGVSSLP